MEGNEGFAFKNSHVCWGHCIFKNIYICNFYGIKKKQFNSSELKKESEKSFELTLQDKLECLVKVFYN